jgi:hypothetical protein
MQLTNTGKCDYLPARRAEVGYKFQRVLKAYYGFTSDGFVCCERRLSYIQQTFLVLCTEATELLYSSVRDLQNSIVQ